MGRERAHARQEHSRLGHARLHAIVRSSPIDPSLPNGRYTADGDGNWTAGPHSLADGHYKLFVEMSHGTFKHKVFKVDCPPAGGGEQGGGGEEEEEQQGGQDVSGQQGQQGQAVLGVQQPGAAGVSPMVETAAQPGAQVAGQQAAPAVAGLENLPSTSTAPVAPPLVSTLLIGAAMWLMRRREGER